MTPTELVDAIAESQRIAVGDGTAKVDGIIAADAAVALDRRLTELVARGVPRGSAHRQTAPR